MLETENPYASPRDATLRPLDEDRPWIDAVRVLKVDRGFLYRRVVLEAPLEMDLIYRGSDVTDKIYIDGQLAAKKIGVWWFVPRFDFELISGGRRVPVVVEVRVWFSLFSFFYVRAFRIEIGGRTVYSEGIWKSPAQATGGVLP